MKHFSSYYTLRCRGNKRTLNCPKEPHPWVIFISLSYCKSCPNPISRIWISLPSMRPGRVVMTWDPISKRALRLLSPSLRFPGQPQRGLYGLQSLLGVKETSTPSLTIFLCKAEEFGGASWEDWREGTHRERNSVSVVSHFRSLP